MFGRETNHKPGFCRQCACAVLLLVLLGLQAGCYRHYTAAERHASMRALEGVRWTDASVLPLAFSYAGCSAEVIEQKDGSATIRLRGIVDGEFTFGVAIAVDSRGYFITAGHNLIRRPLSLVYSDGAQTFAEQPQVIALHSGDQGSLDIAVLRIRRPLAHVQEWATDDGVQRGEPVLAAGANDYDAANGIPPTGFARLGGRLMGIRQVRGPGTKYTILTTNLPLRKGDSGGPLLDAQGKLLGINTRQQFVPIGSPRGIAIRPDLDWLGRLIDDAERRVARGRCPPSALASRFQAAAATRRAPPAPPAAADIVPPRDPPDP